MNNHTPNDNNLIESAVELLKSEHWERIKRDLSCKLSFSISQNLIYQQNIPASFATAG